MHAQTCPYNESLHILWRKRKVFHHHLSGDATGASWSTTVGCMFVYKIKNWHVWACRFATQSVTGWVAGGVFVYWIKTGHTFPPSGWSTGSAFVKNLSHFVATVGVVIKNKLQAWNMKLILEKITIMRKYENNQKTLKNIKKYKTHGKTKKYQKSKNVGWGKKVGVNPRYLICLITWSGSKLRIMLRLTPFLYYYY